MGKEVWKKIPNCRRDYLVSNTGKVVSLFSGSPKEMRSHAVGSGYLGVSICRSPSRNCYVHILVAEAFIGPRPRGHEVNHRDGNKLNNHVDNLEYVTRSENCLHAYRLGLRDSGFPRKITDRQIVAIQELSKLKMNSRLISEIFGVSPSAIRLLLKKSKSQVFSVTRTR